MFMLSAILINIVSKRHCLFLIAFYLRMNDQIIPPASPSQGFDRVIPRWVLALLLGVLVISAFVFVKYITWSMRTPAEVVEQGPVTEVVDDGEKKALEEAQRQLEALDEATKDMPRPTLEESQKQLMELDAQTKDMPRPTEAELKAQLDALDAQIQVQ